MRAKYVFEEAMGGVSSPMATLNNTPGMGNVQPADTAATTGAQQASGSALGSGDSFGSNLGTYTQDGKPKKNKQQNSNSKSSSKKKSKKSSGQKKKKSSKKNENFHIETLDEFLE